MSNPTSPHLDLPGPLPARNPPPGATDQPDTEMTNVSAEVPADQQAPDLGSMLQYSSAEENPGDTDRAAEDRATSTISANDDKALLLEQVYPYIKPPVDPPQQLELIEDLHRALDLSYLTLKDNYEEEFVNELPRILDDLVQTLSHATGATIYTMAMWDNGDDVTEVFETCTERVSKYLSEGWAGHARSKFGSFVHAKLGPTFSRSRSTVWPMVYGLPDFYECRPRLPPEHPDLEQERIVLVVWFRSLAAWQGLSFDVDWVAVGKDVSTGAYKMIERRRLPPEPIDFSNPLDWNDGVVRILGRWIRIHQARLDEDDRTAFDTAFQWIEYEDQAFFRETIHPDSDLLYPEASLAFMSAITRNPLPPHVYLPLDASSRPTLFSEAAISLLTELSSLCSLMVPLMRLLDALERTDAPINVPNEKEPLILSVIPFREHDIASTLQSSVLPAAFSTMSEPTHGDWSASLLLSFVLHGGIGGSTFGPLRRGWAGALRVYLACALALSEIRKLVLLTEQGKLGDFQADYHDGSYKPIRQTLVLLDSELKKELTGRNSSDHVVLPKGTMHTAWNPSRVRHRTPYTEERFESWKPRKRAEILGDHAEKVFWTPRMLVRKGLRAAPGIQPESKPLPSQPERRSPSPIVIDSSASEGQGGTQPANTPQTNLQVIPLPFSNAAEIDKMKEAQQRGERVFKTERAPPVALPAIPESSQSQRSRSEPRKSLEGSENVLGLNMDAPATRPVSPVAFSGLSALAMLNTPSFRAPSSTPQMRGRTLVRSPTVGASRGAFKTVALGTNKDTDPFSGRAATTAGPTEDSKPSVAAQPQSRLEATSQDTRPSIGASLGARAAGRNSQRASPAVQTMSLPSTSAGPAQIRSASITSARRSGPNRGQAKRQRASDEEEEAPKKSRSGSRSQKR